MKKHSNCPLCGGEPKVICELVVDAYICNIVCQGCGLNSSFNSLDETHGEDVSWGKWEEFISKFPPIMRLQEGDIFLKHYDWRSHYFCQIISIDKDDNTIHYKEIDENGILIEYLKMINSVSSISLFPWDLQDVPEERMMGWVDRFTMPDGSVKWEWEMLENN